MLVKTLVNNDRDYFLFSFCNNYHFSLKNEVKNLLNRFAAMNFRRIVKQNFTIKIQLSMNKILDIHTIHSVILKI
jgi:hypothetical protein